MHLLLRGRVWPNIALLYLVDSYHVLVLLQVERFLVLQPPPIRLHAANLFAIVVGDRVLRAAR